MAVILRSERPEVVVTYTADGTYRHPDHRKAHETTMVALDTLAGEGWVPTKLYLNAVPRSFVRGILAVAREAGIQLPGELGQAEGVPDGEITTEVDVCDVLDLKLAACVSHLSQMHPGLALATMAADSSRQPSASSDTSWLAAARCGTGQSAASSPAWAEGPRRRVWPPTGAVTRAGRWTSPSARRRAPDARAGPCHSSRRRSSPARRPPGSRS